MLGCFCGVQLYGLWLWTVTCQTPLSVGFFMQYWSGLLFAPPWDLPDSGIEPRSSALQADYLPLRYQESPIYTLPCVK